MSQRGVASCLAEKIVSSQINPQRLLEFRFGSSKVATVPRDVSEVAYAIGLSLEVAYALEHLQCFENLRFGDAEIAASQSELADVFDALGLALNVASRPKSGQRLFVVPLRVRGFVGQQPHLAEALPTSLQVLEL